MPKLSTEQLTERRELIEFITENRKALTDSDIARISVKEKYSIRHIQNILYGGNTGRVSLLTAIKNQIEKNQKAIA